MAVVRSPLTRKEIVTNLQTRRRENLHLPLEDAENLLWSSAYGGRGGDHLGSHSLPIHFPGAKSVYSCLIEAHEGAEWAADQVKLVLDNQVGWPQRRVGLGGGRRKASALRMTAGIFDVGRA